jgi:hypothetical protein
MVVVEARVVWCGIVKIRREGLDCDAKIRVQEEVK